MYTLGPLSGVMGEALRTSCNVLRAKYDALRTHRDALRTRHNAQCTSQRRTSYLANSSNLFSPGDHEGGRPGPRGLMAPLPFMA